MNIREKYELFEEKYLSIYATKSKYSKGRRKTEKQCEVRTVFQRDRDRILHSKSFRRLKHKTQVFLAPEGDHYRTRLTHTLEVSQISRTIARALRLNEDLTEAIALGHDLGHTPFGHNGEKTLDTLIDTGFKHNEQSLRVVDILEMRNGKKGLNLTEEVRDGILNHTGSNKPFTMEGQIVKISDRIAYINHDIDDAIRAGIITLDQIPKEYINVLGDTHGARINNMILDIINNSENKNEIKMSEVVQDNTNKLRIFLFDNIYYNPTAKSEDEKSKYILENLFEYYLVNFEKLPNLYIESRSSNKCNKQELVKDYIAGMTDRYAIKLFKDIYLPSPWDK